MSEVIAIEQSTTSNSGGGLKDLYEVGEIPPVGHVPEKMYAWSIRKERHGPPDEAMQIEVLPTWKLDSHDVLVFVMAAGVNYNGVWASLAFPFPRSMDTRTPTTSRDRTPPGLSGRSVRR